MAMDGAQIVNRKIYRKEVVMGENLSWFMKLNWPNFTELMLRCKERLENDKINECIARKFPNLIIRK